MCALETAGDDGLPLPRAQDSTWGYRLTFSETISWNTWGPKMRAGHWVVAIRLAGMS